MAVARAAGRSCRKDSRPDGTLERDHSDVPRHDTDTAGDRDERRKAPERYPVCVTNELC